MCVFKIHMKDVFCKECGDEVYCDEDKFVLLGTYTGDKTDDESYFHFECFVKWYNKKVSEKAKNSVKTMQNKVQGLINNPKIAGMLSMFGGTDKLKGMLDTNLDISDDKMDMNKMVADFLGDDPDKMKEGTITPMPKKSIEKVNNNGKQKRKPRAKPKVSKD